MPEIKKTIKISVEEIQELIKRKYNIEIKEFKLSHYGANVEIQ